jgi:hypothetical protein
MPKETVVLEKRHADRLKRIVRRLEDNSFGALLDDCLNAEYSGEIMRLPQFGDNVWHRRIGYIRQSTAGRLEKADAFYLAHQLPAELFKNPLALDLRDEDLISRLRAIHACNSLPEVEYYPDIGGLVFLHFMTNFQNQSGERDLDELVAKYQTVVDDVGFRSEAMVGTCDTYVDQMPTQTEAAIDKLLSSHDGTSIRLVEGDVTVEHFSSEKHLDIGVTSSTHAPCAPIFVQRRGASDLISEFQSLLNPQTKEELLEKFLARYFRDIFGNDYDRIETQLWLRFPHLDSSNKARRLDLFLRNSVSRDWELYEIKRIVPLIGRDYRDVRTLSTEIYGALAQLKNYARILGQEEVRRSLERDGIDYCEPELRLVVGRSPSIPHAQWRRLLADTASEIKVFTYDQLMKRLQISLADRSEQMDMLPRRGSHAT